MCRPIRRSVRTFLSVLLSSLQYLSSGKKTWGSEGGWAAEAGRHSQSVETCDRSENGYRQFEIFFINSAPGLRCYAITSPDSVNCRPSCRWCRRWWWCWWAALDGLKETRHPSRRKPRRSLKVLRRGRRGKYSVDF